jgi:hypothetical protein
MRQNAMLRGCAVAVTITALAGVAANALEAQTPDRQRDRGPGMPTSMFGTYIQKGEFLLYPFFEYYRDRNAEYKPEELGYGLDQDFRGRFRASEGLLFVAWGISDRLAVELEAAVIRAQQTKSADDPSAMPAVLEQSGLGDVEGQLRWRWNQETETSPEFFSYFETVFPLQKKKKLIGTSDWELKLGTGLVRGFPWGTATVRAAVAYDEGSIGPGEYAIEYLKRLSSLLRVLAAVEGSEDEVEFITETQWSLHRNVRLKLNNSFGLTSKAAGWAPEVGIMFSFR